MALRSLRRLARERLPTRVFGPLRAVGTALLAPVLFSARSGHALSALRQRAMDATGKPTLWVTYPVIDLLRSKDLGGRRVLEFGAGQSTLFWAERAASVLSFEDAPAFYEEVRARLPANAGIHLVPYSLAGVAERIAPEPKFDIVLVDGLDRAKACELAQGAIAPNGVIIVDNSEGYWGPEGTYPIMDMFRAAAFQRVDFYGLAPGVFDPHCTSIFFRGSCFLFEGRENPLRYAQE